MSSNDKSTSGAGMGIKKVMHRKKVTQALSKILGEEYILFTKTKNAHYDLSGTDFCDKHQFFEAQCSEFETIVESIGERVRIFGSYVDAMLAAFVTLTGVKILGYKENDRFGRLSELLFDHEKIIARLKSNADIFAVEYNDTETGDFIKGLTEIHERMVWFLKSHLNYYT